MNIEEAFGDKLKVAAGDAWSGVMRLRRGMGKRLPPIFPKTRKLVLKSLEFYEPFVDDPASFFVLPKEAPEFEARREGSYHDGVFKLLVYPSRYEVRSPVVRKLARQFPSNLSGRLAFWSHEGGGRKAVICLHGYSFGQVSAGRTMFKVRKLYEMGLDVALFVAPFHGSRAPARAGSGLLYLVPEAAGWTAENLGRCMHDLRSAELILRGLGAPEVGLVGASLGGYHTGLYSCLSGEHSFGVMTVPAVSFLVFMEALNFGYPFPVDRELLEKLRGVWNIHTPLSHKPKIPAEDIVLITGRDDILCPVRYAEELGRRWPGLRSHILTGGHWLGFDRKERGSLWYGLLQEKGFISAGAGEPGGKQRP